MRFLKPYETAVFALGGLGEVGKNMYCIEHQNELIIIDAGVMLPGEELLGIDYVIPDFTYLKENESKIKALFITHGHEDHIGGISFLLQSVNIPVIYAPKLAAGLINKKLEERKIGFKKVKVFDEKTTFKSKHFEVSFFRTTHSIPDSFGISINTPNGVIVTTSDFKFDLTPVGPVANLHQMAELGKNGVALLLSDSTNAEIPGFGISEGLVDKEVSSIFAREKKGRIIVATFASNIYRLKNIIDISRKHGKKVAVFGRSMEASIEMAVKEGYISDNHTLIEPKDINKYKPHELTLLCTGSQGEALAALSRIASGAHKQIQIMPGDTVIFSSNPIPGNTAGVNKTINKLYRLGVNVYTSAYEQVHASGHAYQEELKFMLQLIKPKYFMPIHGEYRMLKAHADLAKDCGINKNNIFIMENGDVLALSRKRAHIAGKIPVGEVYIDNSGIGNIGDTVIKERQALANDGIIIVNIIINKKDNSFIAPINIMTRGFIHVNDNQELIDTIKTKAEKVIINKLKSGKVRTNELKYDIVQEVSKFINRKMRRNPLIIPMIMEV